MSRVQSAVLCDKGASSLTPFMIFSRNSEKRKILKDEKYHGIVDKSSSEQQFHKSDAITFVV